MTSLASCNQFGSQCLMLCKQKRHWANRVMMWFERTVFWICTSWSSFLYIINNALMTIIYPVAENIYTLPNKVNYIKIINLCSNLLQRFSLMLNKGGLLLMWSPLSIPSHTLRPHGFTLLYFMKKLNIRSAVEIVSSYFMFATEHVCLFMFVCLYVCWW